MYRRLLLLTVSLLAFVPADALARAGGGSRSFRSRPSGGGYSGRGYGGGTHILFFGGGGGGGFLFFILVIVVVVFLLSRRGGRRRRF